nr:hypothetical protein [Tanacetum cinerariifolium]GEX65319.1 hypothetical protein [Tanacetum cinerariifolium]GEX65321.1 hypothetical protein [Tanacetum cinerariifolium]
MVYQDYVPLKPIFIYIRSVAAESECLSATPRPAKPAPAELAQQSSHPFGSQSADPAQPEHQPAPIYLSHEPSGMLSPNLSLNSKNPRANLPDRNTGYYLSITYMYHFLRQLPMSEAMTTTNQGMSLAEVEQIIAQRVANAIETIAIYETKTRMAHESTNQTKQQEGKIVEDTNNKRKWEDDHKGSSIQQ